MIQTVLNKYTYRIEATVTCKQCGKKEMIACPERGYEKWQRGINIHNAMPSLSYEDRKTLTEETCVACRNEQARINAQTLQSLEEPSFDPLIQVWMNAIRRNY